MFSGAHDDDQLTRPAPEEAQQRTHDVITSAMPRILGERERSHWLWPKSPMPCRVFYDSRSNTALNKLFIGGQHGRCIAYDSPSKTHSVVVVSCGDVHTESGSAGVDNVQAQRRSVVERKQAFAELEAVKFAENVRPLNSQ